MDKGENGGKEVPGPTGGECKNARKEQCDREFQHIVQYNTVALVMCD